MAIVAERFTTSKLRELSDLTTISTVAWPLARLSHVVHLSSQSILPLRMLMCVLPTKHEVSFLHQDSIIERIQQGMEEKLLNNNVSSHLCGLC
jgi:hypothetical protein